MKSSSFTLAFDCACSGLSAAVAEGERILAQHFEPTATGQAAALAPLIQRLLKEAGIDAKQLALIGVTNGPGSFTGIRIGLAMARGLALALDVPLAACSTFEAVRANAPAAANARDLIAIDSRRDEIFFELEGHRFIALPEQALARLSTGRYRLIGDGAGLMRAAFAAAGRASEIAAEDDRPPVAANFLPLLIAQGAEHWRARNRREGMPRPLYLREADVTLPKLATLR
jgi:tRNA threonylcarbamoyladenosine biosynthesis protein TsaB